MCRTEHVWQTRPQNFNGVYVKNTFAKYFKRMFAQTNDETFKIYVYWVKKNKIIIALAKHSFPKYTVLTWFNESRYSIVTNEMCFSETFVRSVLTCRCET